MHNQRSLDYAPSFANTLEGTRDDGEVAVMPKRNEPGRFFIQ
jgi:hypothetical protein